MITYPLAEAIGNRKINTGGVKYPAADDPRCRDDMLYPALRPGFRIRPGQKIFTMGSCFARNIERRLGAYDVPILRFVPVEGDPIGQHTNVFNEYNPGAMARRIHTAVAGGGSGDLGILPEGNGHSDFFVTGATEAPLEIVRERRRRMEAITGELVSSDLMIITLGMTESWYDRESGVYLNRAPGPEVMRNPKKGTRFEMRILDVNDCVALLAPAFEAALAAGLKNILLTVSPVPLQRSFSRVDAVIANCASKTTLRTAADILVRDIPRIDYFPSYEMVTLLRGDPYLEDNVHVRNDVVERVTRYMTEVYAG